MDQYDAPPRTIKQITESFKKIYNPVDDPIIIDFGFETYDMNWEFMKYIHPDMLSRLNLTDRQIDGLAEYLNWDILSMKDLSGDIYVKHKDKINWFRFLKNGYKKNIIHLLKVKDKLIEHKHLFFENDIKKTHYTSEFASAFPTFIDWNWYAKNVKIDDYILLRNWSKIRINIICKYQHMSHDVMIAKKNQIKWQYASKLPMDEKTIEELKHYVRWNIICKWQKLSAEFIEKHMDRCNKYAISRYQDLPEWFILKHIKWLNMPVVSQYQNLNVEFLRQYIKLLTLDNLLENKNYNKQNTIQIAKIHSRIYIIDAPIIPSDDNVIFCDINKVIE